MSGLWQTDEPFSFEPYAHAATLGEIFTSARRETELAENTNSAMRALEEAYDQRIDQVRQATGETLSNPLRFRVPFPGSAAIAQGHLPESERAFSEDLFRLSKKHPGVDLGLDRPVIQDAHRMMQEADSDFAQKFSSAEGLGRWLATFGGSAVGTLRDPLQAPLMLLGGTAEVAGKTVLARIGQMAMREGAITAGSQAVVEPSIESSRAEAGLPAGFRRGVGNVILAGTVGAGIGAGGHVLGEGLGRFFRGAPLTEARAAAGHAIDETIRQGFSGRMALGDRALRMMDEDIGAAVKSTLDKARASRGVDRAAAEAEVFGAGDPARVQRIAENFLTPEEAAPKPPQSLVQFLIAEGGVRDFKGEMKALGLDTVSEKFRGNLVKPKGLDLDVARERAAEAGYLGHPDQAMGSTTVADLLNALEEEHRHGPVYAFHDEEVVAQAKQADAVRVENDRVRAVVQQVEAASDRHLPDDIILRAARAAISDGLDPLDALERVIMEDYRAGPPELRPNGTAAETQSFHDTFDPPSLSAPEPGHLSHGAGEQAGPEGANLDGIDIPTGVEIGDEGSAVKMQTFAEMIGEANRGDELAALVAACRTEP